MAFNPLITYLHCHSCGQETDFHPMTYVCPACEGKLELRYDLPKVASRLRQDLKDGKRFGMWRFEALLPVRNEHFSLPIGGTPLIRLPGFGSGVYAKLESGNPSNSMKDRASAVAISAAFQSGTGRIAASSTGNAAASLACLAANSGMPATVFVSSSIPANKLLQIRIFGAEVVMVDGNYDDAFRLCEAACREFNWYNRNTAYNPLTREGKKTAAFEICEQLDWEAPDWIIVPTGDGNILSGIWKGLQELKEMDFISRLPRLVAVQAKGSKAITDAFRRYRPGAKTEIRKVDSDSRIDSISVDFPNDGEAAVRALIDSSGLAIDLPDEEMIDMSAELGRKYGLLVEPAAAAAAAGLAQLRAKGSIAESDTVVCLLTGHGLKNPELLAGAIPKKNIVRVPADISRALAATAKGHNKNT